MLFTKPPMRRSIRSFSSIMSCFSATLYFLRVKKNQNSFFKPLIARLHHAQAARRWFDTAPCCWSPALTCPLSRLRACSSKYLRFYAAPYVKFSIYYKFSNNIELGGSMVRFWWWCWWWIYNIKWGWRRSTLTIAKSPAIWRVDHDLEVVSGCGGFFPVSGLVSVCIRIFAFLFPKIRM